MSRQPQLVVDELRERWAKASALSSQTAGLVAVGCFALELEYALQFLILTGPLGFDGFD